MLIFSPLGHAQECSCPIVQCDPCQRRMVIDSQKVQCTLEKNIVCENVVCENVDNYFQCLAGAQSLHIPAEDAISRMSTPQYKEAVTAPIELPGLEFQHFNTVEATISPDERPGTLPRFRGPANSRKDVEPVNLEKEEPWDHLKEKPQGQSEPLVFKGLFSAMIDGKKIRMAKLHTLTKTESVISAKHKQSATFQYGKISGRMELAPHTELRIVKDEDHLVIHPISGRVTVKNIQAPQMLILDAGEWRIGKIDGEMRWSLNNKDAMVENIKGAAWLRRDQLIAKSEQIPEGMELVISEDYGIVHADKETLLRKPVYQLQEKVQLPKQRRVLASTAIASEGCAQPQAEVQQCAWKCFGAKGKSCVNSDTTQCVRFTCSMGGEWKLPTRVSGKECKANSIEVHHCN